MENKDDFLKDWLEGKISREEINARKEKGDTLAREFDELISKTAGLKVPEKISREEAWKNLSEKLSASSKQEAKAVKLNRWIPVSIAASVALIVVSFFIFNQTTVATQLAETKTYTLPDGSEVILNAETEIKFRTYGWSRAQALTLKGEAFFNVSPGSSFTVKTESGNVTVLGTSFNVRSRSSGLEVLCYSGKVNVASGTREVMLTKGLFTTLEQGQLTSSAPFDVKRATWRNGEFYFEGIPLRTVIDELIRQFNVEIIFTGDDTRLYTGYFNNKNLDEALEMVFKPMSLNYQRDNTKITVN